MSTTSTTSATPVLPKYVFVLLLENRSFDHILGFSQIQGTDPSTGNPTQINGLTNQSNTYNSVTYPATNNAPFQIGADPPHEFLDVFTQIYGPDAKYDSTTINTLTKNMSGFVDSFMTTTSADEGAMDKLTKKQDSAGTIMQAYDTKTQLPVIYSLASEFCVCDYWFSSLPGPTWPNRFFVHGASSMGLDCSPTDKQMAVWDTLDGFKYTNGSIFDSLTSAKIPWRIYGGSSQPEEGSLPIVASLKGVTKWYSFDTFAEDINNDYDAEYTFIEPNYGSILNNTYEGGTSQHPVDDVRGGEMLLKNLYETLRASPIWFQSLLIVTYDEHGGFYDHVTPGATVAPGDSLEYSQYGFDFTQLGVRVPAILISPLLPKNLVDHTQYEHASILAFLEKLFSLKNLNQRDLNANEFSKLFTLTAARTDTPETLPEVDLETDGNNTEVKIEQSFDLTQPSNLNGLLYISKKIHKQLGLPDKDVKSTDDLSAHIKESLAGMKPKTKTASCTSKCIIC